MTTHDTPAAAGRQDPATAGHTHPKPAPRAVRTFMRHWYHVNGVVGAASLAVAALKKKDLSPTQRIMLAQFGVMNLHHCEEFGLPGGFPAMANGLQLHSEHPDRYPLNQATCCLGNNWFNYLVYLPAVFTEQRWLRASVTFFGLVETVMHGGYYTKLTRHPYNAGLATSVLGFLPLSLAYIRRGRSNADDHLDGRDWAAGVAYPIASYLIIFRWLMMTKLASTDTRFPFTPEEMDRVHRSLPNLTDADLYPLAR